MKTYTVIMDDQKRLNVPAQSAADAIQRALVEHLGHRVVQCWVGQLGNDIIWYQDEAFVHYEIPEHVPVFSKPRSTRIRKERGAASLFDDKAIVAESNLAKDKFYHGGLK